MAKSKKITPCNVPKTVNDLIEEGVKLNQIPGGSNLMNTSVTDECAKFAPNANNLHTICNGDAYIVLGSDRPNTKASGYGAVSNRAASIDLVAGRMSATTRSKQQLKTKMAVGPSFEADAARVFISQLSKVDLNFGIARTAREGEVEQPRSTVAIKSDMTRIIGRSGVKIVTGKMKGKNEKNSLGGKIGIPNPPILLMAGNVSDVKTYAPTQLMKRFGIPGDEISDLQPVVLGDNTKDALRGLGRIVEQLHGAVFKLVLIQTGFNAVLGIDPIRPWIPAGASTAVTQTITQVLNSLYHSRVNKIMWEVNYLEPYGYKYICSRNVKTT